MNKPSILRVATFRRIPSQKEIEGRMAQLEQLDLNKEHCVVVYLRHITDDLQEHRQYSVYSNGYYGDDIFHDDGEFFTRQRDGNRFKFFKQPNDLYLTEIHEA